ncbi:IS110 family transposase [Janthinobacterium sp. CG3]|uniref:IS110 family transposase n=1 Tax=Janthinobacterium sp. CG3 TaxID=1075768 RepID=UPI00034C5F44|nr:IS110 family transposase [Janthinobacterium sp. CG3]
MQPTRANDFTPEVEVFAVALELSSKSWKIALHDGKREKPAIQTVSGETAAGRLNETVQEIEKFKAKWGLAVEVRTVVLYEAGQDGFWIERALSKLGYEVVICDPASIPVERHKRRAKTDRLDAIKLVLTLRGWLRGEYDRMHVIRVPTVEAEAQRHVVRDRGELQKETQQHRDRIRKLLRTVGCWDGVGGDVGARLNKRELCCYDGDPLSAQLQQRLEQECKRLELAQQQLAALEKGMAEQLPPEVRQRIADLERLKAVGPVGATRLVLELFWRKFENRRQVGACVGLVPQPYDSGESRVDQGISKQGNRRVRALLIEMSWFWLRYQPDSVMTKWFARRTQGGQNKRGKRIAIVAVARKLVVALWRYLEHGIVPEGAQLKRAA